MGTRGDTWPVGGAPASSGARPGAPASLDTEEVVRTPVSPPSSYTQLTRRGALVLIAAVTGLKRSEGVKIGKRQKNKNLLHIIGSQGNRSAPDEMYFSTLQLTQHTTHSAVTWGRNVKLIFRQKRFTCPEERVQCPRAW